MLLRPPAVAVHDDGDVPGQIGFVETIHSGSTYRFSMMNFRLTITARRHFQGMFLLPPMD
jgi:hypothetical protein